MELYRAGSGPEFYMVVKTRHFSILGWLLVASTTGLRAQVFEASPFFGYRFGGSAQTSNGQHSDLDAARSYGLALDYSGPQPSDIKLELFWSRQDSGLDLNGVNGLSHMDMSVDEFMIGGVYEHGNGRLRETVTGLVGATLFTPEFGDQDARFAFGIGLGVKYFLLKNLALRADLRAYGTVVESEGVFISSGGVTVAYFTGNIIWQGEVSGGLTLAF